MRSRAPSRPNTLRVDGTISDTAFTAALSCASTGTQTGSLNAAWNGTHYAGNFTFSNAGSILVKKLSWSSSDTAVATVDATGMVTGVSPGTATITAAFGSTCWAGSPEPPGGCVGTVAGTAAITVVPAAGPPAAPVNFTAVASGNSVRFSWTPPSTGTLPDGYELIGRQAPGSPILGTAPVGNVTSATITVPSGNFFITVRGSNPQGTGAESNDVVVNLPAPVIPPDPPRNLTASVSGDVVSLSWLPPANSPPGIGYTMMASFTLGGPAAGTIGLGAGQTSFAVNNVPVGTYYVRVVATNEGGASLPSNEVTVTVAPLQIPGAPTMHAAQVNGPFVTLSWTPAAIGGAPTLVRAHGFAHDGRAGDGYAPRQRHDDRRKRAVRHLLHPRGRGECGRHERAVERDPCHGALTHDAAAAGSLDADAPRCAPYFPLLYSASVTFCIQRVSPPKPTFTWMRCVPGTAPCQCTTAGPV